MNMGRDTKLHYKMYKKGRAWIFAGILVMSWGVSSQTARADTASSDKSVSDIVTVTSKTNQLTDQRVELSADQDKPVIQDETKSDEISHKSNVQGTSEADVDAEQKNSIDESDTQSTSSEDEKTVPENPEDEDKVSDDHDGAQNTPKTDIEDNSNVVTQSKGEINTKKAGPGEYEPEQVDTNKITIQSREVTNPKLRSEGIASVNKVAVKDNQVSAVTGVDTSMVPDTALDSGVIGDCTWYINDGELHLVGGTFDGSTSSGNWAWRKDFDQWPNVVNKISIDGEVIASKSLSRMFEGFVGNTIEGLDNLKTDNVTDMSSMFAGDYNVKNIDISMWNISNVVSMQAIFLYCYGLVEVDLPKSINKSLQTSARMFEDDYNLVKVNFNGFTFANVSENTRTFFDCSAITSFGDYVFDLKGSCSRFFGSCSGLESVNVNLIGDKSNTINVIGLFLDCQSLKTIHYKNETPAFIGAIETMFYGCNSLVDFGFNHFNTSQCTSFAGLFAECTSVKTVDLSSLDMSSLIAIDSLFSGCTSLEQIDLMPFASKSIFSLTRLFENCSSLKTVDLTPLHVDEANSLDYMFSGCTSLTVLDLSPFVENKFSNLESVSGMFQGCTGLSSLSLDFLKDVELRYVDHLFDGCNNLKQIDLTPINSGSLTSTSGMFKDCTDLTTINLLSLNVENVINMSSMFSGCTGLQDLDFSSFKANVVSDLSYMFEGCTGLKSIKMPVINLESIREMDGMFLDCTQLKSATIGSELSEYKSLYSTIEMFRNCRSLELFSFGKIDSPYLRQMDATFSGCESLEQFKLTALNTENLRTIDNMFDDCLSLKQVDLSNLKAPFLNSMRGAFAFCNSLENVNLANIQIGGDADLMFLFFNDLNLRSVDFTDFAVDGMMNMSFTFSNCRNLEQLDLSSLKTDGIDMLAYTFANCDSLRKINLGNLDTSSTNYFWGTFLNDGSLSELDLSYFDMRNAQPLGMKLSEKVLAIDTPEKLSEMLDSVEGEKKYIESDHTYSPIENLLQGTTNLGKLTLGPNTVLSDIDGNAGLSATNAETYTGYWLNQMTAETLTTDNLYASDQTRTEPVTYLRTVEPTINLKKTQVPITIGKTNTWSASNNISSSSDELGNPADKIVVTWNKPLDLTSPGKYTVTYAYKTADGAYTATNQATLIVGYPIEIKLKSTDISMYIGLKNATWTPANNVLTATDELGKSIKEKLDYQVTPILARSRSNQLDMTQPGRYRIDYLYNGNIISSAFLTLLKSKAAVDAIDSVLIADPKTTWNSTLHQPTAIDEDGQVVTTIKTSIVDQASGENVSAINTHRAGNYQITFSFVDGVENRVYKVVNLKILANQATIKTKDSQLTVGAQWHAKDNFVSATDYTGKPITIDDLKVDGTVNWQKPGQYLVHYMYDKNPELTPITKTALITVAAAVTPVDPGDSGGHVQPDPEPVYPEVVPEQTNKDPQSNPEPVIDVDTGKSVKPTTEIKSKLKPETNVRKADLQQEAESNSNVAAVKPRVSNKLNTDNQQLSSANGQKSSQLLPQTNDSRPSTWISLLGINLLGLMGLLGFRRKTR
ncbi:BspA family leucine-rich repeat surface protein [Lactiplantibacillus songbeiensis]|uniref:BspA family leucine-rich repeat surface protein n=1 Tax=Lactiplantibacillus songbeiensis TaxID=2559920 RepID=A0ABW4C398_9LACO|nr:BspA family leucine-rich repeat surface protein [Lactiplantibacillus songbeiensis]